ncbi:MAG: hypothetical protein M1828_005968 [Chrysothrix sp. TS-e1954]|nr:MAG: hypothetical protein M1828_005968 [Chrysothrix sp. TS-e1954]
MTGPVESGSVTINTPKDPCTLSNYNNFQTTHTSVDLRIDFAKKLVQGNVILSLESLTNAETEEVVLDTSHLFIEAVTIDNKPLRWSLAPRFEPFGSPLSIKLDKGVPKDETIDVNISVSTTDKCTALQWMTPEQTSNRKHPYMCSITDFKQPVSQCQAIHARSLFPCQDTPSIKSTFAFRITSPHFVIASGLRPSENPSEKSLTHPTETVYHFTQNVPIPAYLFALASGDIVEAPIGPRSVVATSPDQLKACVWEFEKDTENYIKNAEELVFPYEWGTYNLLILPPSFPYGGMENPVYTFATPTAVSSDRENVDLIAHELSHSWSGNLVSPVSWEHFWLNEGWTTYLERRLQARLFGEPFRDFSSIIGWKALEDSIEQFGAEHDFTKLITDLKGRDPDDAFSTVPYEKGGTFLWYLDDLVGRENWDRFIPHYFTTWKYKSLDSYDFKSTLLDFFKSDSIVSSKLETVDWDTWFYAPGLPPKPAFDTSMVDVCYALASNWQTLSSTPDSSSFQPSLSDISSWRANQVVAFLETLQSGPALTPTATRLMGDTYNLLTSKNVEVLARYLVVGLLAKDDSVKEPTVHLLGKVGRMKFVRPLFRHLREVDEGLARSCFEANKSFYHPICRAMVEKDLLKNKKKG